MELDELQSHWNHFRTAHEPEVVPEDTLYDMLPAEGRSPFWQLLLKASRYVGVYGSLLICCHGC